MSEATGEVGLIGWLARLKRRRERVGEVHVGAPDPTARRVCAFVDAYLERTIGPPVWADGFPRFGTMKVAPGHSAAAGRGAQIVDYAARQHDVLIDAIASPGWRRMKRSYKAPAVATIGQGEAALLRWARRRAQRGAELPWLTCREQPLDQGGTCPGHAMSLERAIASHRGDHATRFHAANNTRGDVDVGPSVSWGDLMIAEPHRPTPRAGTHWGDNGGVFGSDPQEIGDLLNPTWELAMVCILCRAKREILSYRRRLAMGQTAEDPTAAHIGLQGSASGPTNALRIHEPDGGQRVISAGAHPAVIIAQVGLPGPEWWQGLSQDRQRQLVAWLLSRTSFRAGGGDGQVAARTVHQWLTRPNRIPKLLQADAAASDDQRRKDALRNLAKAIAVVTANKLKAS